MSEQKLIYKKIAAVMAEVGAIGKDRRNQGQGYNFRGIDDVYNAVHPLFVQHGIFSIPRVLRSERSERTTEKGTTLLYSIVEMEYTFCAEDGSSVVASAVGEGMDSGDKATNKAMSAAHKYAIIQLLAIPTCEPKDPENDDHKIKAQVPPPADNPPGWGNTPGLEKEDLPRFPAPKLIREESGQVQAGTGICPQCGGKMMISKYANKVTGAFDFYCSKCKKSVPRTA